MEFVWCGVNHIHKGVNTSMAFVNKKKIFTPLQGVLRKQNTLSRENPIQGGGHNLCILGK